MTNFTNEQIGALMAKHNGLDEKLTEEAKGLDYGAIDESVFLALDIVCGLNY